ncbi:helix-turn-helix domain-containing protein [Parabacteroides sp. PF5-9]|uniref:helix-turn-helix domain-containing protein n=1 Tax=Parabacteroides sp. PF5-9 TaxID=1742404 RepID=UPI002474B6EC|nr:helix-turn-helix domain-containing protein [Parabacteroides sp. PF5-9]MDH6356254.1 hypothetical protein [Parabacteroides sp. PF5-9]
MSINEIIQSGAKVTLAVSLTDLQTWHKDVIRQTKEELEQTIKESQAETYLSPKATAEKLEVDPSTLHRWKVKGYLIPVEVGGKRRYRMSDINRILEGGKRA